MAKLHKVEGFPWWMNTRWGRWLCTHWRPAAVAWQTVMAKRLYDEAHGELTAARAGLLLAANRYVVRDFDEDSRGELVRAWCTWRNAREREHRAADELWGRPLEHVQLEDPVWAKGEP